jgi:hypothetical protein
VVLARIETLPGALTREVTSKVYGVLRLTAPSDTGEPAEAGAEFQVTPLSVQPLSGAR